MADPLTLTDRLALDRNVLANERTVLAYLRTALGFGAAGVTLWRFSPHDPTDRGVAFVSVLLGAVLLVVGVWRFVAAHRRYGVTRSGGGFDAP